MKTLTENLSKLLQEHQCTKLKRIAHSKQAWKYYNHYPTIEFLACKCGKIYYQEKTANKSGEIKEYRGPLSIEQIKKQVPYLSKLETEILMWRGRLIKIF